jgi:hypothetical protein
LDPTTSNNARRYGAAWLRDDRHSLILAGTMWALIVLMSFSGLLDYEYLALPTSAEPSAALWLGCWR